ncbi:hypothetical protein [Duganella callida]|uniref:Uncharacterized protein n=1 Tax=Duganella callida TaxID=2561932 RepID=A0A4Y9S9B1_9BURK|nr:hypothetical protein [Duganella callida]TFW18329.1 hypothetical protein E4L98_18660 [Duganella callida]
MRALIATGLFAASAAAQTGDHRADVAYYTQRYDGADIALSHFHCGAASAVRTADERSAWLACYGRFTANYQAALPVGRSIPAEVADAMSDAELAQAQKRMSEVFVQIAQEARLQAGLVLQAQGNGALSARSASDRPPSLPVQTHPPEDRP